MPLKKLKDLCALIEPWTVWSFPLKLMLGALGVFGGAGFLAFLSDYATYSYAIFTGVRPPMEGVPYLSVAVAFLSIFLLFTGALSFVIAYVFLAAVMRFSTASTKVEAAVFRMLKLDMQHAEVMNVLRRLRTLPLKRRLSICLLASLSLSVMLMGVFVFIYKDSTLVTETENWDVWYRTLGFSFVYLLTLMILLLVPTAVWPLSVCAVAVYFVTAIILLFQPNEYAKFLRVVGYGGGLPIKMYCKDPVLQNHLAQTEVSLILRTNDTMIVLDTRSERFLEIPRAEVVYFSYRTGGLNSSPVLLPPTG